MENPVIKDNALTREIARVEQMNRGTPLARGVKMMGVAPSERRPAVTTGAMQRVEYDVPPIVSSLPPEEQARRDSLLGLSDVPFRRPDPFSEGENKPAPRYRAIPDFSKITLIDITRGYILVDGVEVPVEASALRDLRNWCIEIITSVVTLEVAKALAQLAVDTVTATEVEATPIDTTEPVAPEKPKRGRKKKVKVS